MLTGIRSPAPLPEPGGGGGGGGADAFGFSVVSSAIFSLERKRSLVVSRPIHVNVESGLRSAAHRERFGGFTDDYFERVNPYGPILLIEADPDIREGFSDFFELSGHRAVSFATEAEALDWLDEEEPSVVLLDAPLTGLDASPLLQRLERAPFLEQVPVIVLTSSLWLPTARTARGTPNVRQVLVKPIALDVLLARDPPRAQRRGRGGRTTSELPPHLGSESVNVVRPSAVDSTASSPRCAWTTWRAM